jgi:hypothetical protein
MNEWIRVKELEESFQTLHRIKPIIYKPKLNVLNFNTVKLEQKGKTVILTEELQNGLTKQVILEVNGNTIQFNNKSIKPEPLMYEAECEAVKIFKE